MKKISKKIFLALLLLIAFFSFLTRFYQVDIIPPVITHDEIYYAAEAKSIVVSGHDPSGLWSPLSLTSAHPLFAELPGSIMAISAFFIRNNPILSVRFTQVLLGSLLPVLLAAVTYQLSKNKNLSLVVALVSSLNPWLHQVSRMGFDSLLSIFFYSLGSWFLLRFKNWTKLWAVIPFFLGFFQYQGHKVIFLPLILLLITYILIKENTLEIKSIWKKQKPLLVLVAFSLLLFSSFIFRLSGQTAQSRNNDLIIFDQERLAEKVIEERRNAFATPLQKIYINKATVLVKEISYRYLDAFNPVQLFLKGEPLRNPTSVWYFGIFFPVDIVFIIAGLLYIFKNKNNFKDFWLILGLILIGPLPSAINNKEAWHFLRSSFMFPFLSILVAIGIYSLWQKKPYALITRFAISSILMIFSLSYFYNYFYQYPVYSAQKPFIGHKIISNYISRLEARPVVVLADESRFVFESYLVYTDQINKENIPQINQAVQTDNYLLDKVTMKTECFTKSMTEENQVIFTDQSTAPCPDENAALIVPPQSAIRALTDGAIIYGIRNDFLCEPYREMSPLSLSRNSLDMESLSDEEFCRTYISKYAN